MEQPKVSVVLVNFRGVDDTLNAIKSIKETNYPKNLIEIVVVDNASGDDSVTKLKALKKLLAFKRNIPKGKPVPESMIQQYLNEEAQINKLMGEATGEMVKEYKQKTTDELNMLDLERRRAALNNQMPQAVTKDESIKRKWIKSFSSINLW
mgnify:CR=1 FL=1